MKKLFVIPLLLMLGLQPLWAGSYIIADKENNSETMLKIDFERNDIVVSLCESALERLSSCEEQGVISERALREIHGVNGRTMRAGATFGYSGAAGMILSLLYTVATGDMPFAAFTASTGCALMGTMIMQLGDVTTFNGELGRALKAKKECSLSDAHTVRNIDGYLHIEQRILGLLAR